MIKSTKLTIIIFICLFPLHSLSQNEPQLKCDIGPISAIFGGNNWTLYSCTDNLSITLVSTPKSPAHPFYFMLLHENGEYTLSGDGSGKEAAAKATRSELEQLTQDEVKQLIEKTKTMHDQ